MTYSNSRAIQGETERETIKPKKTRWSERGRKEVRMKKRKLN